MSAQPEVAITIMTGGHAAPGSAGGGPEPTPLDRLDDPATSRGSTTRAAGPEPTPLDRLDDAAAPGGSTTAASGPEPVPLDQLATVGTRSEAGGPVPDQTAFGDASHSSAPPTPQEGVTQTSSSAEAPTPLDLDQLEANAPPAKPAARKQAAAKRSSSTS